MGNRGILHQDYHLYSSRWRHKAWICCLLSFKGRKRELMSPNNYTELFFLDEAVALAVGHRPCAECRRSDFNAFSEAFMCAHNCDHPRTPIRAQEMDKILHADRIHPRTREQRRHEAEARTLPDGSMILHEGNPALIFGKAFLPYSPEGYGEAQNIPQEKVTVLTPKITVDVLRAGYRPVFHPSAQR